MKGQSPSNSVLYIFLYKYCDYCNVTLSRYLEVNVTRRRKRQIKEAVAWAAAVVCAGLAVIWSYSYDSDRNRQLAQRWGSTIQAEVVALGPAQWLSVATDEGVEPLLRQNAQLKFAQEGKVSYERAWLDADTNVGDTFKLWRDAEGAVTSDNDYRGPAERGLLYTLVAVLFGVTAFAVMYMLAWSVLGLIDLASRAWKRISKAEPTPT